MCHKSFTATNKTIIFPNLFLTNVTFGVNVLICDVIFWRYENLYLLVKKHLEKLLAM